MDVRMFVLHVFPLSRRIFAEILDGQVCLASRTKQACGVNRRQFPWPPHYEDYNTPRIFNFEHYFTVVGAL
jgi:hypothetical protein